MLAFDYTFELFSCEGAVVGHNIFGAPCGYRCGDAHTCFLASIFVIGFRISHSSRCPCVFHPMFWHRLLQYRALLHPMHLKPVEGRCKLHNNKPEGPTLLPEKCLNVSDCVLEACLVHVQHPLIVRGGGCCKDVHPTKAEAWICVPFGFAT